MTSQSSALDALLDPKMWTCTVGYEQSVNRTTTHGALQAAFSEANMLQRKVREYEATLRDITERTSPDGELYRGLARSACLRFGVECEGSP